MIFTYGVREQQHLQVLYGGDGAVSNQLHQGCRQWIPLKHTHTHTQVDALKEETIKKHNKHSAKVMRKIK